MTSDLSIEDRIERLEIWAKGTSAWAKQTRQVLILITMAAILLSVEMWRARSAA